MKKFLIVALALALTGSVAYASFCARDYVPAATLLVPFGIVDLDDSYAPNYSGYTTLLTVTNVSAERILIHVTVWSVLTTPVVDFDEVLTGYDVWSINFRDLLEGHFEKFDTAVERVNGTITKTPDYEGFWGPQDMNAATYDNGATLGPTPVPFGPTTNCLTVPTLPKPQDVDYDWLSDPLANCYFPYGYLPNVGADVLYYLLDDMSMYVIPQYDCELNSVTTAPWLKNFDDTQAWFYVTVDVVNFCSQNFPTMSGYWCEDTPAEKNIIIGDVIYLDYSNRYSESIPAVSVEADRDLENDFTNSYDTFYGNPGWSWIDCDGTGPDPEFNHDSREPIGTAYAFRYLGGGVQSFLRVWKHGNELSRYCSGGKNYYFWYAGASYAYYAWDENENTKSRGGGPSGYLTKEPNVLPWETQEVPLNPANWSGLFDGNGWMLLVFDQSIVPYQMGWYSGYFWSSTSNCSALPFYHNYIDAWVGVKYVLGGYSTMLEAAQMANAWCWPQQSLEFGLPWYILGANFDYDAYWWE